MIFEVIVLEHKRKKKTQENQEKKSKNKHKLSMNNPHCLFVIYSLCNPKAILCISVMG
jgi:hypothetical protein